ncbi:MAG: preprotein translocase subunit SecE [Thermodesulfobacteriota bacterium]
MGKLLRKKPTDKKKKKKPDDGTVVSSPDSEADEKKKVISLTDFSRDKKKPVLLKVKPEAPAKPSGPFKEKLDEWMQFLREVKVELKKVTWPSRTQTLGSTAVVIVLVMIISLFLGLVDAGLSSVVRFVLH